MKRCALVLIASLFLTLWATQFLPGSAQVSAQEMSGSDCLACHNDPKLTKEVDGKTVSLHVDEKSFAQSVHASVDCAGCHSDVKGVPHEPAPAKVSCAQCHDQADTAYTKGVHAKAIQGGNAKAAGCVDCHGGPHEILPSTDSASRVNHARIAQTCGSCHGEKFVMEGSGISARPFISYQESVHGRAVAAGNAKAAACTDCHGSHDIRPPTEAESPISKFNVPKTCGQCHQNVAAQFSLSIHGQAITRGNWQAPVCTDCHGIHMIKPHVDPTSSVAAQALARTTCAQCHEGVRLSQEFGVAGRRASTYLDSYHGLASELGSKVVANCASCHGVHNILPSAHPDSMINQANLVQTCGQCHPGASENFIIGNVHLDVPTSEDIASSATRWVRWIYLSLIAVVVGGMLVHNGLIWRKKALARRGAQKRTIVRLTLNQRLQHWVLLVSFTVLVLTGFALRYPDSWLADLLGSSESIRRIGHRVAAVILMAVGVYHLGYLAFTREGRSTFRDLLPVRKDVLDLIKNLRYYLARSARKPEFGRFGYVEKAEYWAAVWGVVIMAITGSMVWFKVDVFGFVPRWVIDVALAIHFYEAILASLAVVVWHFYHVIFDPDVYPLNWAVLDGRVSDDYYREEHALAYRELAEAGAKQGAEMPSTRESVPGETEGFSPSQAGSADD